MSAPANNLYLCGFMGAGKSTVGPRLAARLGWSFVDTDRAIEIRAGQTIPELFARSGEGAFRALEKELVDSVSLGQGQVIALGGGTLLDDRNRETVLASGRLVHLKARRETILSRIEGGNGRPLLSGADLPSLVDRLSRERESLYSCASCSVDTDDLSPDAIVERILEKVGA